MGKPGHTAPPTLIPGLFLPLGGGRRVTRPFSLSDTLAPARWGSCPGVLPGGPAWGSCGTGLGLFRKSCEDTGTQGKSSSWE